MLLLQLLSSPSVTSTLTHEELLRRFWPAVVYRLWWEGLPFICGGISADHRRVQSATPYVTHKLLKNSSARTTGRRDPVYAATISSHNYRRLARALEIVSQTGAPLSNRHQTPPIPQQLDYDFRCFALVPTPRELLFRQIDERSEQLVARGLLREVGELLLARALLPQHPLTTAIGYRHALQLYASPPITSQLFLHFVSTMQSATRQLAVQQLKWLRHEPTFQWLRLPLNAQGSEESAINQMLQYFSLSEDEYHERRAREEHVSEQNTLKTLSAEEMRRQCRYRPFLKVFCHEEKVHEQVAIASEYVARLSRHGALQPSLFSQGQQTQSPPTASLLFKNLETSQVEMQ
jgi:hypothetical protein